MLSELSLASAPVRLPWPDDTEPPPFGRYAGVVADLDVSRWPGRRTTRKAWLYLGAYGERWLAGFAIADAGWVATAFVYVLDRATGRLTERKVTVPFGFARGFQPNLDTTWQLRKGGQHWVIQASTEGWQGEYRSADWEVRIEVRSGSGMSTLAPAQGRPFHYTYKVAGTQATCFVREGANKQGHMALGLVDFSKGFPPRQTFWNWAGLTGHTAEGRAVGINLVADFNNGLENALWFGGALQPLGQAIFRYSTATITAPWRLLTADGKLDLTFYPEGVRAEKIHVGLLLSDFFQPCGRFEGWIRQGDRVSRLNGYGVVEHHRAIW